jgi:hypothetical protein
MGAPCFSVSDTVLETRPAIAGHRSATGHATTWSFVILWVPLGVTFTNRAADLRL